MGMMTRSRLTSYVRARHVEGPKAWSWAIGWSAESLSSHSYIFGVLMTVARRRFGGPAYCSVGSIAKQDRGS